MIRRVGPRDEAGAVAVLVSVFALVMFGLAALVVDLGQARDARLRAQTAADASALAGAGVMRPSSTTADIAGAMTKVRDYAANNEGVTSADWSACNDPERPADFTVPAGGSPCISFRNSGGLPVEIRVRMPSTRVETRLASLFGVDEVPVTASAQALVQPGGASRCGLCVIGGGDHPLQNGDTTVNGADIHFNGNVAVGPNGLVVTNGQITVEGTAGGSVSNYTPPPITGSANITDPLAAVPLPPDYSTLTAKTNPCTGGPGIYGARNLRNATCTLAAGLYIIAGNGSATWDLAGNASTRLLGTGVTLYFTCGSTTTPRACNPGEAGANIDASGNGFIGITGPSSGPLQGFAIIYDRNNTSSILLTGNGSQNMTGTIYGASATLDARGNGCSTVFNSLVIIKNLAYSGNNACLRLAYSSGQNAQIPPGNLRLSK